MMVTRWSDPAERWYVCDDSRQIDFRDHQPEAKLAAPTNGWTATYEFESDVWLVRTPEGQPRTYRRIA